MEKVHGYMGLEECGRNFVNERVRHIYKRVTSSPVGPDSKTYKREVRRYTHSLSKDTAADILARADDIERQSWRVWDSRLKIFLGLGFMETEAKMYARCRLNSPGIRKLMMERVFVTQYATPKEITQINTGDRGVLRALVSLYGGKNR